MKTSFLTICCACCVFVACSTKSNDPSQKKPNQYSLFVNLGGRYQKQYFKLYSDNKLIYKGRHSIEEMPFSSIMFIKNLRKRELTKFRLVTFDKDTVFYVPTMNVDSLKIGMFDDMFSITDNHKRGAWILE